ncbi:MAG TPA: hypothetical protein VLW84_05725 [Terriglobales bacterium]|nr:hypothetical protein [Terriglobales bacterium]
MATGITGINEQPDAGAQLQRLQLEQRAKAGASWLVWVAGLSMVNSLVSGFGGSIRFIFGLGVTQIVDAVSHQVGSAGLVLDLIINGIVVGLFVLLWHFARKGQKWAFILGLGLYALDGLLLIPFQDYLGLAFHAYALWRIYQGFQAASELEAMGPIGLATGGDIQPR